jgi:hypothetical protein
MISIDSVTGSSRADRQVRQHLRPSEGEEVPISVLSIDRSDLVIWTSSKPLPEESFPPCIRNIIIRPCPGPGKHRASAILASFLGQAGWEKEEARELWSRAVEKAGIAGKPEIFECWFQKMHCPRCETIQKESKGYPRLGLSGLPYCEPDESCRLFSGPVAYAAGLEGELDSTEKGRLLVTRTVNLAKVMDWRTGQEGVIELSDEERTSLESLLSAKGDRTLIYTRSKVGRKLKPRFYLKEDAEAPRRAVLSELL